MLQEIKLFLFVLCLINDIRFIIELAFKLTQETPEPLVIKDAEKVLLYLSTAYIITYFLI